MGGGDDEVEQSFKVSGFRSFKVKTQRQFVSLPVMSEPGILQHQVRQASNSIHTTTEAHGKKAQFKFGSGCLVSVLAPIVGIVLYPRANWLFAFVFVGIALILLNILTTKPLTPQEGADRAERLLNGDYGSYDVDDYEHLNPKDPQLQDLWQRSLAVGGLPEEWVRLNEAKRNEVREIIRDLRQWGVVD